MHIPRWPHSTTQLHLHGSDCLFYFLIVFILPGHESVENRVLVWIPGQFMPTDRRLLSAGSAFVQSRERRAARWATGTSFCGVW